MIGLLLREALDRLHVRLNVYLVYATLNLLIITYDFCYARESDEVDEVLLTNEEQECKPLLSSKSSESSQHASKAVAACSASLLTENLVQMNRKPCDVVKQHLLKVCFIHIRHFLSCCWCMFML